MKYLLLIPFLFVYSSHAMDQMYNWNGLEFVRSGNAHHVHPASPESTLLRGGTVLSAQVSPTAPEINARALMPYKTQTPQYIDVKAKINPKSFAAAATGALKTGLKGASSGYVGLALIACDLACSAAKDLLLGSGIDSVKSDGQNLTFSGPDPSYPTPSNTSEFATLSYGTSSGWQSSMEAACRAAVSYGAPYGSYSRIDGVYCVWNDTRYGELRNVISTRSKTCPSGSYIKNGVCEVGLPKKEYSEDQISQQFETYPNPNTGYWGTKAATLAALVEAAKNGRLIDATGISLSGPASSPISTTTKTESVNLQPGTTNPVPDGYTGPTESGTRTTTTSSTVKNSYNGNTITSTPEKLTTTTITNNVTNTTNIVNQTTEKTDEPPEQEEEIKDTPLSDLPDLYKQKYPNGLKGVVTQKIEVLKATPLFSLPMQLMGNLPDNGNCPSWQLDLNLATWANFGTHNIGADCSVWQFASVVVLISAFILARALVFGG